MNSNIQAFVKRANKEAEKATPSLVRESLKSIGMGLIPLPAVTKGTLGGFLEHNGSRENATFVPGGIGYVRAKRIQNQVKEQEARAAKAKIPSRARGNVIGELLGGTTSLVLPTLLTTGIGAGIGALAADNNCRGAGALAGSVAGLIAAAGIGVGSSAIGAITAAIKRRRTAEEQMKHDSTHTISNWIIPGVSTYNYYKRLGRSQGDLEEGLYDPK